MGHNQYEKFVNYELEGLSKTIISMQDFYEELKNNKHTRLGTYNYYKEVMKISNDTIKALNNNWQIVPDHMATKVSSAISYTKSVQGDLYREMIASPLVHMDILNLTSRNRKIDDKAYSYMCCLEKVHICTLNLQKQQDYYVNHYYDISSIQNILYDAFQNISTAAFMWSNDIATMLEGTKTPIDLRFLQHTQTITEKAIHPFLKVINKHMEQLHYAMIRFIKKAAIFNGTRRNHSEIIHYYRVATDMQEIIDRDVYYLLGQEADVDINKQIDIFDERMNKIKYTLHYYNTEYNNLSTHTSHNAQYIGSKTTGDI